MWRVRSPLCRSEGTKISKRSRSYLTLGAGWATGRETSKKSEHDKQRLRRGQGSVYCGWSSLFTFRKRPRSYWKDSSEAGLKGCGSLPGEFSFRLREMESQYRKRITFINRQLPSMYSPKRVRRTDSDLQRIMKSVFYR